MVKVTALRCSVNGGAFQEMRPPVEEVVPVDLIISIAPEINQLYLTMNGNDMIAIIRPQDTQRVVRALAKRGY